MVNCDVGSIIAFIIRATYSKEMRINKMILYHAKSAPSSKMKKFIKKRRVPKIEARIIYHLGRANGPIIFLSATNFINGTRANGSWMDCWMFRAESIFVSVSGLKKVTQIAGTIAIERVRRTLCQIGSVKSRNPSITN